MGRSSVGGLERCGDLGGGANKDQYNSPFLFEHKPKIAKEERKKRESLYTLPSRRIISSIMYARVAREGEICLRRLLLGSPRKFN